MTINVTGSDDRSACEPLLERVQEDEGSDGASEDGIPLRMNLVMILKTGIPLTVIPAREILGKVAWEKEA